jgi:superfamily I DNA/RNA helicase
MKDNYTSEQKKYIKYKEKCNTKLLACAGSGKTRCIIARMDQLIKKHIYSCENIMMLTFTRFTKDDFISKIESYGAKHININCIKTIDSFAKSFDYFSILPVNVRLPVVNIFNVDFISGNVNVAPGCNSG